MGIVDLSQEDFLKLKEIVRLLGTFGISEEDLRYLPEAIKIVKASKLPKESPKISEEIKKELEDKKEKVFSAEEFISQFKSDVEEFYPNGKQVK